MAPATAPGRTRSPSSSRTRRRSGATTRAGAAPARSTRSAMGREAPAAVLAFINAFNDEDLERLDEVLDPDVVIHSMRGPRSGRDAALAWARRVPEGELRQHIELEAIKVDGDQAVALVRK